MDNAGSFFFIKLQSFDLSCLRGMKHADTDGMSRPDNTKTDTANSGMDRDQKGTDTDDIAGRAHTKRGRQWKS